MCRNVFSIAIQKLKDACVFLSYLNKVSANLTIRIQQELCSKTFERFGIFDVMFLDIG